MGTGLVARRYHLHRRTYKDVKLTSPGRVSEGSGRSLQPSLDGNVRRAIDIQEGEKVDESAFKALIRQAVSLNSSAKSKPSKKAKS
jgi:hypothetical protein